MQDVQDEQKELLVRFHSKKLAIAIGLRNTSCNMWKMSKKNLLVGFCNWFGFFNEKLPIA